MDKRFAEQDAWIVRLDQCGTIGTLETAIAWIAGVVQDRYPFDYEEGFVKGNYIPEYMEAIARIKLRCLIEGYASGDDGRWEISRAEGRDRREC